MRIVANRKYSAKPEDSSALLPESGILSPRTVATPAHKNMLSPHEEKTDAAVCIELNIGQGISEQIYMYEGQDPNEIIESICQKYGLQDVAREKLGYIIRGQLLAINGGNM